MSDRLLTIDAFAAKLDCSRATIYRLISSDPRCPRPVRLPGRGGKGDSRWLESEIQTYIGWLVADRAKGAA